MLIWIGGREFLSPNEAMALLPAGEPFEVACEVGGVRLQATWSWGEVVDQIFDSVAEIPGERALAAGYGLALSDLAGTWFVKTER